MFNPINKIINKVNKTDSPIEEIIYDELVSYGLKPLPQYPVGLFFIDLAFPEIKLAIEADGHAYHTSKEQKKRDSYRQKRIENWGWKFERFTGSFIHNNKELVVAKIVLKYFKDKISKEKQELATSHVVRYIMKKGNIDLGVDIVEAYLGGYILKKIARKRKVK